MSQVLIKKSPAKVKKFNTLQILQGSLYLTWGGSLLFLIITLTGINAQRQTIKTIGKDTIPNIIIARTIKTASAGIDANVINRLLLAKSDPNLKAVEKCDKEDTDCNERHKSLAERLIGAAKKMDDEIEKKADSPKDTQTELIKNMILNVNDYLMKIQRARDFNEQNKPQEVLKTYQEAAKIMDEKILSAAEELSKINSEELDKTYKKYVLSYDTTIFLIGISGLLLLGILIGLQIFLNYKMKRLLNPMLLAASGITLIFLGYIMVSLQISFSDIKFAKEDAFTSVRELGKARISAYIARTDQSRYLLDKGNAEQHEKAFFDKIATIKRILEEQLNNSTSPGQKESVLKSLRRYEDIDKQIRQLEKSGKHSEAIALCTGSQILQSNGSFKEFIKDQETILNYYQDQFKNKIKEGEEKLNNFEITVPLMMFIVGGLTLLGLKPRIKEYSD